MTNELNGAVIPMTSVPVWLTVAFKEVGVKEVAGKAANPRIVEYLGTCTKLPKEWASSDETPWCSAFMNWCMRQAGIVGPDSAAARDWLHWGIRMNKPTPGAVAVLSRDGGGHVALYVHHDKERGRLWLFGGNQNNEVGLWPYDASRLLEYRWPAPLHHLISPR